MQSNKKYIVIDMADDTQMPYVHDSIERAREAAQEIIDRVSEDKIPSLYGEEGCGIIIAEIVETSKIHIRERKAEYEERGEPWPYDEDWNWVGELAMTPEKIIFPDDAFATDDRGNVKD